jgi:hypothetical protein
VNKKIMVFKKKKVEKPEPVEQVEEFEDMELEGENLEAEEGNVPEEEAVEQVSKQKKQEITIEDVLQNHESRIREIEAAFFRLRNV